MTRIAKSLIDLIGDTPMLELKNYSKIAKLRGKLFAKLEYFNPGGSIKDRVGYAMIKEAEDKKILNKNSVIIEPTSGNTGIGLALVSAIKGYRLILTMPETMSLERRNLLKGLGAELVLTPGEDGMEGAIRKANELAETLADSFIPQQFENQANPAIHKKTTAKEIWRDMEGEIDILVAGIGTGGTITGIGEFLKEKNPNITVIAVEPASSAVLSGGEAGPHEIQGIGAGFVPNILNTEIYDELIAVDDDLAYQTTRQLIKTEGLLVGISSGAAVQGASIIARRPENKDKNIVVILPDTGERYLSTPLFE